MGSQNTHALLHSLFHHSVIYPYTNPSVNFIYRCAAILLCYVVLHVRCSTVSSALTKLEFF
jgi:hypothetical protein